ncbi:MAG: HEPN domain-containing protein [Rhodospirillales bacterium]|nr:HEPN domain-containing protein [Rhodospirillales bacterium]
MSAPDPAREEAGRWYAIASEDLRVAKTCLTLSPPALGNGAYHCQQAAEKMMKGLLVFAGTGFRKVHDLDELADLTSPLYPGLAADLDLCRRYSSWAIECRYPPEDDAPPPSEKSIGAAVTVLERLLAAIRRLA